MPTATLTIDAPTPSTPPAHPAQPPRKRILLSAFAMSPTRGSELAIAWQLCTGIARHHDVVVISYPGVLESFRDQTQSWIAANGPIPGMTIHYVEPTPLLRFLDRGSNSPRRMFFYYGYASWQRRALREAKKLHARQPFDAVHHVTVTGFREPGYLWKLGIPFFWGPVSGASNLPWKYFSILGLRDRIVYAVRNIANEIQKRISLRCRRAARSAAHIWALFPDNRKLVTDIWHCPCTHMFESGAAPRSQASIKNYDGHGPLQLIFSSYHVGRKALPLALHALTRLDDQTPVELAVLGDGPERKRWQALSHNLGLDSGRPQRVVWLDNLPHSQALARMAAAHAMVFPSLLEASSNVIPEAFSLGVPVICHDLCGMSLLATPQCAIKVAADGVEASIAGLAAAIGRLAHEGGLVKRLSEGALRRSKEVSWTRHADEIAETYSRVLAGRAAGD
jgi:glycosyltransferase involved in cell wall biosynthesis